MNEKAIMNGEEYSLLEVLPVLNEKTKMVLCADAAGGKYVCRKSLALPCVPSTG
jgi:hypothetical protein